MDHEGPGGPDALRRTATLGVEETLAFLRSTREGLSAEEAAVRLATSGRNELPERR